MNQVGAVFERFRKARKDARERAALDQLLDDARQLMTERGESNSIAIATRALGHYRHLGADAVQRFFEVLASEYDPDPAEMLALAQQYAETRSPEALIALQRVADPPRQALLRRLNLAPGGTGTLVAMRARLLERLKGDASLKAVDADFQHLLSSWFNPGFLQLAEVDWNSPAQLLEKIIHHEAVHEIDGWADLRRRLEPDRRCFAFFHPALPDEPLIFVEVALLEEMPSAIAPLLDRKGEPQADADRFRVAAFYSISNCQPGLRGVNLGNFLIKRVADRLKQQFPKLKTFCTLSPIPGFAGWLAKVETLESSRLKPAAVAGLQAGLDELRERYGKDWSLLATPPEEGGARTAEARRLDADRQMLHRLCAFFLLHTAPGDARGSDPVARFHLNNGARLERINPAADLSRKGIRQSHGLMVNYLYDLDEIEANHEKFVDGRVSASRAVLSMP
ncbi:malonyl-CoA decarboxylase [Burkholderiaceae bacterium FT117]|uniref:malonyl-CoA decarboxylase n=1 Tax=Zeimonas sediminis TaxID=2944268 RepID=UPI00234320DA|nr:malonyl-CoA decarboxylase [Zeimonas sediminis]MCM5572214.1 malonyl-CoA decarboxylase [Zeimonas sediminis]